MVKVARGSPGEGDSYTRSSVSCAGVERNGDIDAERLAKTGHGHKHGQSSVDNNEMVGSEMFNSTADAINNARVHSSTAKTALDLREILIEKVLETRVPFGMLSLTMTLDGGTSF